MQEHKILIFEKIHKMGTELLESEGCEIVFPESPDQSTLLRLAPSISGIIVRARGEVSERLMKAAPRLKVVGRHGVGLDNVDVLAATDLGIWVVNTPEANSESVAEHFLVLALMLSKKVPQTMRALFQGDWESRNVYLGQELFGKTIGIVGFGRVGQTIGRICCSAFASKILYYDLIPRPACEAEINAKMTELEDLLRESDYVSLNLPLVPETVGLIGENEFSLMKKSAFIINTSRGQVWKETALLRALREGWIAGAGTDVFEQEPVAPDNPLFELENFVATPHNAAHTEEAMQRMAMVAEDILTVLKGGEPRYPVNRPKRGLR